MNIEDLLRKVAQGRGGGEWSDGDGENDSFGRGPWRRPDYRNVKIPKLPILAGILVILTLMCFTGAVDFYTDILWFESLGLASVIWGRIIPQVVLAVLYTAITAAVYGLNWHWALGVGTRERDGVTGGDSLRTPRIYVTVCALAAAAAGGVAFSSNWRTVMLFLHGSEFGYSDAIFGRDIGFYIFSMPLINVIQGWVMNMAIVSLAGNALIYILLRSLRSEGTRIILARRARFHLLLLAAVVLAAFGAGLWVSRYELLHSPSGIVYGMGYADLHVRLPGLTILSAAVMASSALIMINFYRPMWRASAIAIGALLAAGFLSQTALPFLVQGYIVQPNEYEREKEFLSHHISATRRAFGIDGVRSIQAAPAPEVTMDDMREDSETVENIRLWDYGPLLRTYKQLQEIRTYYEFEDIDIDRYEIDGKNRQVMLSVRELDQSQLQNRTWVNSHLEFTHGYGVVMNPVNEMEEGGLPVFFMKDLPPKSSVPIAIDRPQIYYGEKPNTYALVRTEVKEFDYPMGDSNARSTYEGAGGVPIGSLARRILYAIKYRDSEILFTDSLTEESRILCNRNVREAVAEVAPFLILEEDVYPIIVNGRVLWLQDAYTASSAYPYSRPLPLNIAVQTGLAPYAGVNYIRNSVKITVDAYDGLMTFYVTDPSDPLILSWAGIFPGLFKSREEIPPQIEAHFRYPEEFFEAQSEVYRTYHMTDTNTYYNREDVWMTTPQGQDRRIRPNYVTIQLMDEPQPEFTLIAPFMPYGRNNLIGWIAGRSEAGHYGELVVYQFPKQELVFGPPQIEALIDQNTVISSQLSLWSQRGSDVIRGDLLVIPIGRSLLYVQPLYLKADRGDLPELKRIILSTGGRVAWGETFSDAALELFGGNTGPEPAPTIDSPVPPAPDAASQIGASAHKLAVEARTHYESAMTAIRSGDWALYGQELEELGTLLDRLESLTIQER
ncbi:MAG: UPF0182 family protein [Synergistaceae bacterium]|jgi:uncharacterized membrane protein (UPF0182 family)|nr:UPF0182 family protein [Synergistaceae bacterium]